MTETAIDIKAYIRDVPDFPKAGIMYKDITTLLIDPRAFQETIKILANRYKGQNISKIVGVESRGFIFASALAFDLGIGLALVRKRGKLPSKCVQESYDLEYGSDIVEMHCDAIESGETALVVDDLIATGGTLVAACKLVESLGGKVTEVATIVELEFLNGKEKLEGRPFFSMIQF